MEVIPQLAILFMEVQLRHSNVSARGVETAILNGRPLCWQC